MKILLISANPEIEPYKIMPLGLAYVAATLEQSGHDVKITDPFIEGDYISNVKKIVENFEPEVIGVSIRNIDNNKLPPNTKFYLETVRDIVRLCKEISNSKIVLGGTGFSILPADILKYIGGDAGIIGEGELAFLRLVQNFETGKKTYDNVPGLIVRNNGRLVINDSMPISNLDLLPFPARHLMELQKYFGDEGRIIGNLQTKRGCIFRCAYCTYSLIEGNVPRLQSPKKVVDEIETMVYEHGIEQIHMVDSVFNYPVDHVKNICEEIINRQVDIQWECYARPDFISRSLLLDMKKAGCKKIVLGADSCVREVLEGLNKDLSVSSIVKASQYCRETEMEFCQSLLFGGPNETRQTVMRTFQIIEKTMPHAVSAGIGIRIYPGTMVEQLALREGLISRDTDLLFPKFYLSPNVQIQELQEIVDTKMKSFPTRRTA